MLVPSDTLSGLLWVEIAKAALFTGLLHINAVKKLAAEYLMQWQQPFLRYFWTSIPLVCPWQTSLLLKLPGRSPWTLWYTFDLCLAYSRRNSSLNYLPHPFHLRHTQGTLSLMPSLLFIRPRITPSSQSGLKTQYLIWAFIPTITILTFIILEKQIFFLKRFFEEVMGKKIYFLKKAFFENILLYIEKHFWKHYIFFKKKLRIFFLKVSDLPSLKNRFFFSLFWKNF